MESDSVVQVGEFRLKYLFGFLQDDCSSLAGGYPAEDQGMGEGVKRGIMSDSITQVGSDCPVDGCGFPVSFGHEFLDALEFLGQAEV